MNRNYYYNQIVGILGVYSYKIIHKGKVNLLDDNIHSENFYIYFLKLIYNWELENLNKNIHNSPGADLIEKNNKFIIQVSSTVTKEKINKSLDKKYLENYKGYTFKFISIAKNADDLREKTYINKHNLIFDPVKDIICIDIILNEIISFNIDKIKEIYEFLKNELVPETSPEKIETNLAQVINILSKEDLENKDLDIEIRSFEIERKINFNEIEEVKYLINEYKIYYSMLDSKYKEFDRQGANKSRSILNNLKSKYHKIKANENFKNSDDIFWEIVRKTRDKVLKSGNYLPIPDEELDECVRIIIVDAFIRCKIFENPKGYEYVSAR